MDRTARVIKVFVNSILSHNDNAAALFDQMTKAIESRVAKIAAARLCLGVTRNDT